MDEKKAPQPDQAAPETGKPLSEKRKSALLRYMAVLFCAAFILVLISLILQTHSSEAKISELNAAAKDVDFDHFDPTMVPVAVELTRQPLSPNDKDYINKVLGEGTIEVQMQGFAKSTIRQTSVRGLWRSRILNKAGKELLDQVEATPLPPEIPSTAEDLPGAIKKMDDLIEWVELDLSRGAL